MGNLEQDAGSITSLAIGAFSTAVTQILKNLESVIDELVTLSAMDVHYHAHTARIVFVGTAVQSVLLHLLMFLFFTYQFVCKSTQYLTDCKDFPEVYSK